MYLINVQISMKPLNSGDVNKEAAVTEESTRKIIQ